MRTPAPSDWEHAKILMSRNLRNDGKKPQLWFARVFGMPLLVCVVFRCVLHEFWFSVFFLLMLMLMLMLMLISLSLSTCD
jgi:hypothetical protein